MKFSLRGIMICNLAICIALAMAYYVLRNLEPMCLVRAIDVGSHEDVHCEVIIDGKVRGTTPCQVPQKLFVAREPRSGYHLVVNGRSLFLLGENANYVSMSGPHDTRFTVCGGSYFGKTDRFGIGRLRGDCEFGIDVTPKSRSEYLTLKLLERNSSGLVRLELQVDANAWEPAVSEGAFKFKLLDGAWTASSQRTSGEVILERSTAREQDGKLVFVFDIKPPSDEAFWLIGHLWLDESQRISRGVGYFWIPPASTR